MSIQFTRNPYQSISIPTPAALALRYGISVELGCRKEVEK